ncbi:MAG: histidine ammonia-lyase [Saprospiraceae bacterium]|nr:histidine ammonia-lyase [Saprospiraceae bacterium]
MYVINNDFTSLDDLRKIFYSKDKLFVSEKSRELVEQCYSFLHNKINNSEALFYGINTGFGSLCNIQISDTELTELQHNIVQSHAAGTGDLVPLPIIKLMLFLKIKNLSFGHSGVHINTLNRLVDMYNADVLPVIFQLGSLGASGDLAPLAHLSLPLIGKGEVYYKEERQSSAAVLKTENWSPISLQAKEGLALLNGTQFSLAYGVHACLKAQELSTLADMIAAMSIDAFACVLSPFDERLHKIRPHQGQLTTAQAILDWLTNSQIGAAPKNTVQDPYAFRCVPQVHGASKDAINYVKGVLETEVNSVTDNPNIFPDTDAILSGGNFHAQPVALALDFLAIALSELGSISERRIYQLISGKRNLPAFLTPNSGLHSGLMIAQYTAASIASQNKQLCTPASVDSIVSCNGQEDHVSMAANAGTKLYKVVQNVERLLAIELMCAAQALSFRELETSPKLAEIITKYRAVVPVLEEDRIIHNDIENTIQFIQNLSQKG